MTIQHTNDKRFFTWKIPTQRLKIKKLKNIGSKTSDLKSTIRNHNTQFYLANAT